MPYINNPANYTFEALSVALIGNYELVCWRAINGLLQQDLVFGAADTQNPVVWAFGDALHVGAVI
ncbi:hypothetical protein [Pontibacter oryzae]|uniref:Uncharacterized protein n=1 Tax=Pontibacter oryzae TaxID=2304593 RepID=A0A399RRD8_9BACT|nr:hypothetical protein [Pontibacter oryzae]RIJ34286.1 hypothetical protein D1627_15290 [Pontibacter oryzae]